MDPLFQLSLATLIFLATHFVTSTPLRGGLVAALGEKRYIGLYSLVAAASLVWMAIAYANTPHGEPLWSGPQWLPAVVMPFALVLIVCGYFRNPTMVMADRLLKSDDPARGMIRVTRHPIMWGLILWAGAHLIARGDAKTLVFFGGLLLVAASGTLLMDWRKSRNLGADWLRFAAVTSHVPFVAIAQGRNRFDAREIGWKRPLIGLVAYLLLLFSHQAIFGVRAW
jgi:uncharacterized membrane protein